MRTNVATAQQQPSLRVMRTSTTNVFHFCTFFRDAIVFLSHVDDPPKRVAITDVVKAFVTIVAGRAGREDELEAMNACKRQSWSGWALMNMAELKDFGKHHNQKRENTMIYACSHCQ